MANGLTVQFRHANTEALALPQPGKAALEEDFLAPIGRFNGAKDGTMVVAAEYLEVVI